LNIISHVEYSIGGYYLNGGMIKLTEALYKLAEKKGVKFNFNSPVESIITENRHVKAIKVNGNITPAKKIVSNADVYSTYKYLLQDISSKEAIKYLNLEPSSSALVFYWGVKIHSENLETHNILFSGDYRKEFTELFDKKVLPEDPTVYIYISKKFSPQDAPDGEENWFVMINAPNGIFELGIKDLESIKKKILNKIRKLTGYDIMDRIVCEKVMTPRDIEYQTGSYKGSIYGISSNNRKAAFLRQRNRSRQYKGLYFCGGSAHPGGGIPLVILSGKLASRAVISD
jgi:phytoene desaturase